MFLPDAKSFPAHALILAAGLLAAISPHATAAEAGDPDRGKKVFSRCKGCHAVGPKAGNKAGPHLNNLFGRSAASVDGFGYSRAMTRAGADGLVWSSKTLDLFVENPKSLVSGSRMSFRGIGDEGQRRDLMAYLRKFAASPRDIPESAPTASPSDPEIDAAVLAIEGDADYGAYLSSECTTCHQASGSDAGIPSITGWPSEDFVAAMRSYKTKARPHPAMRMIAGRLSDHEIASLAVYFKSLGE